MVDMARHIFICSNCGTRYSNPSLTCPLCNGLLLATYESPLIFDKAYGLDSWGLKRYLGALPIENVHVTLGEGNTPIIKLGRIREKIGVRDLIAKDESRNPTGSFVDRGVSVFVNYFSESACWVTRTM